MASKPQLANSSFKFVDFSNRQKLVMSWWMKQCPYHDMDGIIADGAIRSGKTLAMSLSFVRWAMSTFDGQQFGICGKTIGSLRRNVITPLKSMLASPSQHYEVRDARSDNKLVIRHGTVENTFYLFGGRDESSQDLVQGVTLAGIMLDEVVLMPETFVNQATSRCSVEGSKIWFSCNPENRMHWFKTNWINQYKRKRLLYVHFTMDDNLSLSESTKEKYKNRYVGMFYQRYIEGAWVSASGVIYDMWSDENTFTDDEFSRCVDVSNCRHMVAMDYGTTNPMVFLEAYDDGTTYWINREYYYSSRIHQRQKTDEQYADDFDDFIGCDKSVDVIIDPSAESFRAELRNRGYRVIAAKNAVQDGIRTMATMIQKRRLRVNAKRCPWFLREMEGYVWDADAAKAGLEKPVKVADHCMDACRYLIKTTADSWRISN